MHRVRKEGQRPVSRDLSLVVPIYARPQGCLRRLIGSPGAAELELLDQARAGLERELPFRVFVDALDEYVQAVEPRRLYSMDVVTRNELTHVLPSLPVGDELPPERYRAYRAMRQLLEALALPVPGAKPSGCPRRSVRPYACAHR